jgi:hypothetical protein
MFHFAMEALGDAIVVPPLAFGVEYLKLVANLLVTLLLSRTARAARDAGGGGGVRRRIWFQLQP